MRCQVLNLFKKMKIEITMTELMLIIDMIRDGKDNEGQDTYTLGELAKAFNTKEK